MNLEFKKLVKKALKEALTEQKINGKKCCKCKDKILINQKRCPKSCPETKCGESRGVKKECCEDSQGNITHSSDYPTGQCPKSQTAVPCEGPPPRGGGNAHTHMAEASVTADNTKFNIRTGVNKTPTKLGIKIQFEPTGGMLDSELKSKLEVALQEKLNGALSQYNIQVSKDTDVPRDEVIGFFIPLSQIKNMIVSSLEGPKQQTPGTPPKPPTPPTPPPPPAPLNEMRMRDLNEISKVVIKEDFYDFINKGNNILRSCEDAGITNGKKYLIYLIKHNIM